MNLDFCCFQGKSECRDIQAFFSSSLRQDVLSEGGANCRVQVGEDLRQHRAEADLDGHLPDRQLPGHLHPRAGDNGDQI